jgi:predicted RNA methylase
MEKLVDTNNASSAQVNNRYTDVSKSKAEGVTYTPQNLSDFVARQILQYAQPAIENKMRLRILDPAVGNGQLLVSLISSLTSYSQSAIDVYGFEIDKEALSEAVKSISQQFPRVNLHLRVGSFLQYVSNQFEIREDTGFHSSPILEPFDLVIANPPYVRTQILGANQASILAREFNLDGRVDLYYAFLLGISRVLKPDGTAGIIVPNRFMMTKAGSSVRRGILEKFNIRHIWDMGDTKLFNVAVLPCVLLLEGKGLTANNKNTEAQFTSIYTTTKPEQERYSDPISALAASGVVSISDGRRFLVTQGLLETGSIPGSVWRITTASVDTWLEIVKKHTSAKFSDIGKVRVGVKTTADKVFIRSDWEKMMDETRPELLRPVITHKVAQRFKASVIKTPQKILYPYEIKDGKRSLIDIEKFPCTKSYFEKYHDILAGREYLHEANRQWYEIWVPQDPEAWSKPKLVTRDISEKPTFWMDLDGCVVNGDCYWITSDDRTNDDLLWFALAVGNSKFIEVFYDHKFHNQLYAGRRRFITQYVEEFPLPRQDTIQARNIISLAKRIYSVVPSLEAVGMEEELDKMVWQVFGLDIKEFPR